MVELAQTLYEAYSEAAGGVSLVSGDTLPAWDDLAVEVAEAWRAVASTAEAVLLGASGTGEGVPEDAPEDALPTEG